MTCSRTPSAARRTINSTNFGDGGNELFTDPPGCLFHHQASFMSDFFKSQGGAADGDFDFFVMPEIKPEFAGALTGGGDLFGLFSDKAAAKDLLKYLVTAEAQQIWADRGRLRLRQHQGHDLSRRSRPEVGRRDQGRHASSASTAAT